LSSDTRNNQIAIAAINKSTYMSKNELNRVEPSSARVQSTNQKGNKYELKQNHYYK
jgi:hypothetical protein